MKKGLKARIAALAAASAVSLQAFSALPLGTAVAAETTEYTQFPLTVEAETLEGNVYDQNNPGKPWTSVNGILISNGEFSGEGFAYVQGNTISMTVTVPEDAMYEIDLKAAYVNEGGKSTGNLETITINDREYNKTIPYTTDWIDFSFGKVRLAAGENTINFVGAKYGYYEIDTITIKEAEFPDLTLASAEPCDPDATPETKALMSYLHSVYGKNILSGQQQIYGGGNGRDTTIRYDAENNKCVDSDGKEYTFSEDDISTADDGSKFVWKCFDENGQQYNYNSQNRNYTYNYYNLDVDLVYSMTGKYPAIQGFDFGSYCPCYAWDDGVAGRMIDWTNNKGGICTASWHINVPTTMADYTLGEPLDFAKTTYSEKTDFVTANCMVEGTAEYDYFQLCMKNLANELLKLQDAGVPLIFRPFHEAEGNGYKYEDGSDGKGSWFWWGKEGSKVYKELWAFLQDTLQNEYGLHNLIYEQNLYAWSDDSAMWYSGDDRVDLVAYDKYNVQYNRHDGKTSGPNLDAESGIFYTLVDHVDNHKMVAMAENDTVPSMDNMLVEHAYWLYFCPWYDTPSDPFVSGDQDADEFKAIYNSDFCITLDELPEDLFSSSGQQTTTKEPAVTTTREMPGINYGDANEDGKVNMADAVAVLQNLANSTKYPLTATGEINADCDGETGLTGSDAITILRVESGEMKQSDLPLSK